MRVRMRRRRMIGGVEEDDDRRGSYDGLKRSERKRRISIMLHAVTSSGAIT